LTAQGKLDVAALPTICDQELPRPAAVVPRNLTEARLVVLWEELLKSVPIGVHDNFFDLGGHSLMAVRMLALVQQRFWRRVQPSAFLVRPTVAHLASLLGQADERRDDSALVSLQPSGRLPPFFCVHPIGGEVLSTSISPLLSGLIDRFMRSNPSRTAAQRQSRNWRRDTL